MRSLVVLAGCLLVASPVAAQDGEAAPDHSPFAPPEAVPPPPVTGQVEVHVHTRPPPPPQETGDQPATYGPAGGQVVYVPTPPPAPPPPPVVAPTAADQWAAVGLAQSRARHRRKRVFGILMLVGGVAMTAIGVGMMKAAVDGDGCGLDCGDEVGLFLGGFSLFVAGPSIAIPGIFVLASANRRLREIDRMNPGAARWQPRLALDPDGGFRLELAHRF